jgi:AraC-like DNA-binding protein
MVSGRGLAVTEPETFELLLRGIAIGAQLAIGISVARSTENSALRWATIMFFLSNICLTLNGFHPIRPMLEPFTYAIWLIQIGGAGYSWLFIVTLFEDWRPTLRGWIPALVLTILGAAGTYGGMFSRTLIWGLHNAIGIALAAHTLYVVAHSWRNDLIEARRRLRGPYLVGVALFSIVLGAAQIGQIMGIDAQWYDFAAATAQTLFGVAGAAILLEARRSLFGRTALASAAEGESATSSADLAALTRLNAVMNNEALWRREGLTVGELAQEVGIPEHRLRRLINDRLGHRNFTVFVNQRRIDAARMALTEHRDGHQTIASIAFDLGFGSLGPFNRAFREATGLTPTEYRRRAESQSSPIVENPR